MNEYKPKGLAQDRATPNKLKHRQSVRDKIQAKLEAMRMKEEYELCAVTSI